jgi:sporulation protein YlmC with PRC-barrel domain
MKRNLQILLSASASSILAFSTLAQDTPIPKTDSPNYTRERASHAQRADRLNGAAKASDLIGMEVKNYQDEKLGKVEDLALDVESGRIVQVILSTGGFIGIGDTLTAVPPGALHHDIAQKVLHLDADKAKLTRAPKFENSKWDEGTQSNRVTEAYAYYGEQPYFVANRDGYRPASEDVKLVKTLPRHSDGTINTDGARTVESVRNKEAERNVAETHNTLSTRNPDGTWNREYSPNGNGTNSSWSSLGYIQKASKLIGTSVQNLQDEKLGKVENIMLDMASGRIVAVIISSGGFLGMGDELSAVPSSALRFTAERDSLQLDASKEMLSSAPHFKANQWPDFNEPSYTHGVYRAYNIEPYFTTAGPADIDHTRRNVRDRDNRALGAQEPDNTGRNIRDRNDQTLTPLNQGNSKSDVDTTAKIRKEIIAGENLSVNARNVKIITIDGRVTLRGPVNTAEEKRLIGAIADRIAISGNVDNQLEVKSTSGDN